MCRLLLIKTNSPTPLTPYLTQLATIAQTSNIWQGDGWGIAYKVNPTAPWQWHKSLQPIWQEPHLFDSFPPGTFALIHARGAFGNATKTIENIHPFQQKDWLFAMNGNIKKVRLKIPGSIGAKKVQNLTMKAMLHASPAQALRHTEEIIEHNSGYTQGMNCVLTNGKQIHVLCKYGEMPDYYTLRYYQDHEKLIITSSPFGNWDFKSMHNKQILSW
jgi:predicted glutamine amidotransferase